MAAVPQAFTVIDAINQIGITDRTLFNGATKAQRIATELFDDDFTSCLDKTFSEIDEDLKSWSALTVNNGQIRLTPMQKKNLKAFRQDLGYGNVAIKILMPFDKEKERIPRFKGLFLDDQKLPREIQDLLKLRIEEALHVMKVEEKINQFRQRMEEFVPGLRREAQDLTQLFLCDNVAPRQTEEDDIIRLGEVTDEHLNVIEKYLDLREKSSLFRR